MAWEFEDVGQGNSNAVENNWELEPVNIPSQTVLDDDSGEVYSVPVTFDETDTRFAIDTQVKGEDKANYLGKVKVLGDDIEKGFNSFNRGVVGFVQQASDTAIHASYHYPEKLKRLKEVESGDFSRYGDNLDENQKLAIVEENRKKVEFVENMRKKTNAFFDKSKEILLAKEEMSSVNRFVESLGSGAASVGASMATFVATKNPTVAAGILAGTFGRMRYTDVFDKAIEKGIDVDDADDYAFIAGSIEGGIEAALGPILAKVSKVGAFKKISDTVIDRALSKYVQNKAAQGVSKKIVSKNVDSVVQNAVKGFAIEGGEEASQQLSGMAFENWAGISDYTSNEMLNETLLSLTVGGLTGLGSATIGTSAYNKETKIVNERIKDAIIKDHPDLESKEVQNIADGIQDVLYQNSNAYNDELTKLIDKEFDFDAIPQGIDAKSLTDNTRRILKDRYKMSDKEIDLTIDNSLAMVDARNQFNEAYTLMFDKLTKDGGRDIRLADAEARLFATRATTIAKNERTTVDNVLNRWGLQFENLGSDNFIKSLKVKSLYKDLERVKANKGKIKDNRKSLSQFLKEKGGVVDFGGNLKSQDVHKYAIGLINKNGMSLDDATQLAWESGYLSGAERPEINDLLNKLDEDLSVNKVYSSLEEKSNDWEQAQYDEMLLAELDKANVDLDSESIDDIYHKLVNMQKRRDSILSQEEVNLEDIEGIDDFIMFQDNVENSLKPKESEIKNFEGNVLYKRKGSNLQTISKQVLEASKLNPMNDSLLKKDDVVNDTLYQGQVSNGVLTIDTKEEMQGISDDDFRNKMVDALKSLKGRKIFNASLNGDIEIRTSSIKKYKSFFADENKRLIVPYIPELLEKANFVSEDTYTPETESNILAYWKADLPITIDGNNFGVHLTVKEDQNGNLFWDAQVKEKALRTDPATNPGDKGLKADKSAYEDSIVLDKKKVNNTLYQVTDSKRGAYARVNNTSLITLFEKADASTIIHEAAHFFLDDMRRFNYSAETQSQLEAIYKYVGSLDGRLSREQNEYFARSFEAYLMDGRSPNNLLSKVFARFKNWLSKIYKTVKNLDVDLDDNIKKTFDEMLGGRGIDYTMQVSGAKMLENLNEGTISTNSINKAMGLLKDGKMSRSDMEELISRLKTGEIKRADFKPALKKFEESNNIHHEQISSMALNFYKRQLEYGNFSKSDVKAKILRLVGFTKPRTNGGKLVGRFSDIKVNQAFDNIREKLETPKDKALEEMKINMEIIENITKGQTEGNVQELSWNNKLLSIAAEKASAKILVDVYNAISDTYNSGRLSNEVTGEVKKAYRKRLINEVLRVLGQGDGADWRKEVSTFKKVMRNFGRSIYGWNGVLDILSMFDKTSQVGNSKINQNLSVFAEETKMRQLVADDGERLSNLISEVLGGVGNKAISVSRYLNKELPKKFKLEWGNNLRNYSKDELIDIYMKVKDPETKQMMLSDKILQFNETFLAKVDALLTEEDIAVANSLFKFYNETYDKLNEFYEDHYGVSLGKREFYSPRSMDKGGIDVMNGDLKSYAGLSATKVRTAKAGPIKVRGAMVVVNDYIANSNHYMAFADKLQDINASLGDAEVKNVIRNLFGEDMNKKIGYEIGRFASNDKVFSQGVSKALSMIRSNYAVSALAIKPSITIKQLTSFPAYWEHLSSKEFMDGIIDFAKNPKKAMEILGSSTLMKTRGVNIIRDFEIISNNERLKNIGTKTGFREFLMMNVQLGDRGAIYLGGWAVYKKVLKQTQSPEKALAAFEKITNETQQSSFMSEQSAMQSNPFMAMFTMFQSSQNQYLRKEITAMRGLLTGRIDKEKAMKTLFIYHFLLPMLFQFVSDGFRWDKDAQLRTAVIGSLNGAFILGDIIEKLADLVITQKKPQATRARDMIPFWGTGEDIVDFLYKSMKFAKDDIYLEDYVEAMQKFGKSAGELSGLPIKYGLDVVNNLGEYVEDKEYGKAGLLSLGWSPYALRDLDDK